MLLDYESSEKRRVLLEWTSPSFYLARTRLTLPSTNAELLMLLRLRHLPSKLSRSRFPYFYYTRHSWSNLTCIHAGVGEERTVRNCTCTSFVVTAGRSLPSSNFWQSALEGWFRCGVLVSTKRQLTQLASMHQNQEVDPRSTGFSLTFSLLLNWKAQSGRALVRKRSLDRDPSLLMPISTEEVHTCSRRWIISCRFLKF